MTTLIVHDDGVDRAEYRRFLTDSCFDVVEAATREDALARARSAGPDVVLLAGELSGQDGLDVLREFQQHADTSCLPVVVVTTASREHVGLEAMRCGAQDYLLREEISPQLLKKAVLHALERVTLTRTMQQTMRELERARVEADAASRAKTEFIANMSHEIRTPMTAILGFADALLEGEANENVPLQQVAAINTIRRNGQHLLEIINGILDLTKIEAGKLEVERRACRPADLVHQVTDMMRARAEAKDLRLQSEFLGNIPETIESDETRLRQILVNLVGNAIKFTNIGGVRIEARFVEAGPDSRMEFDVVDTGIGMTAKHIARLFQPFTQAEPSTTRRFGGSGLGLSISKRLAVMLGGDVVLVESRPGVGSRFRLTVAAGRCGRSLTDPTRSTVERSGNEPAAESVPTLGCRVLLAEDNADNQRLISHVLHRAGAEVTAVDNGRLAIELVREALAEGVPFDIILMDVQMPEIDGLEATRRLRASGHPGPIIAITAGALSGDRQKCLDAGCDAYETKPINRHSLLATVRRSLQGTKAQASSESAC